MTSKIEWLWKTTKDSIKDTKMSKYLLYYCLDSMLLAETQAGTKPTTNTQLEEQ